MFSVMTLCPIVAATGVAPMLAVGELDFVAPLLGAIVVAYGIYYAQKAFCRTRVPTRRIRDLLGCTLAEAAMVEQHMAEVGVRWMQFYGWVNTCECKLMPMMFFDNGKDDQFIATWGESHRAILRLAAERRFDPTWERMDAVGVVSVEIIKERQAKSNGIYMPTMTMLDEDEY